jgi:hypothetical protein
MATPFAQTHPVDEHELRKAGLMNVLRKKRETTFLGGWAKIPILLCHSTAILCVLGFREQRNRKPG